MRRSPFAIIHLFINPFNAYHYEKLVSSTSFKERQVGLAV